MNKEISFGEKARDAMKKGIDELANAVKVTLGPYGKNVFIRKPFQPSVITKDGVSVAREIAFEDPLMDMGAQAVKDVARQTNDLAGDGTTTATVLAQDIFARGLKMLAVGFNPTEMKRGIDIAVEDIVAELKNLAEPIKDDFDKVAQVGTISANGDEEIGRLISNAMSQITSDGIITIEESKTRETTIEVVDGMQIDTGWLAPHFITDFEKAKCDFKDAFIVLYSGELTLIKDCLKLLEALIETQKPIIFIAHSVNGEALGTFIKNTERAGYPFCAINAPGYGEEREFILQDIAILIGGKIVSKDLGDSLNDLEVELVGRASRIEVFRNRTVIVAEGRDDEVKQRVQDLRVQLKDAAEHDIPRIKDRIARLDGGIAVMKVGAESQLELKEKKDRVEDALNATKAAVEEGIVPGGGVAFVRAVANLKARKKFESNSVRAGYDLIIEAMESPLKCIVDNAGAEEDTVAKIRNGSGNYGYDARKGEFCDLVEAGVIDPVKVPRVALEKAASISGTLLTTECAIYFDEEKLKDEVAKLSGK